MWLASSCRSSGSATAFRLLGLVSGEGSKARPRARTGCTASAWRTSLCVPRCVSARIAAKQPLAEPFPLGSQDHIERERLALGLPQEIGGCARELPTLLRRRSCIVWKSRSAPRASTDWPCPCAVSANTRRDSLSDLIKLKANLRVACRTCEKVSVIDASRFYRYCLLRCWNSQLEGLGAG